MKVSDHVKAAIDDANAGKIESALLHACIAIDATSRAMFPHERSVGRRYTQCLRAYYWLLEPMIGGGINLEETRFGNIESMKAKEPDLAEIIYEIFRCNHAHGDEVPLQFSLIKTEGPFGSTWLYAQDRLHMPDRIVWALLAVAVFARANVSQSSTGSYYLTYGVTKFVIKDSWGKEDQVRDLFIDAERPRVTMNGLGNPWIARWTPSTEELRSFGVQLPD